MKNDEMKTMIVVVGPGRSGTSAIVRGLRVFGVDLGDNLMPPKSGVNEKGFWEDLDFYALNNDIFKSLDHGWDKLTPVNLSALSREKFNNLKLRAIELTRKKTASVNLFGIKDPQMTRLLPFWREVFSYLSFQDSYVIACRNPASVVHSLSKYTGFSIKKSYLLWFEHTLASLIDTAGAKRLIVSYDNLMQDPLQQLRRIGNALHLPFDANGKDCLEYCSDFLDIGLRHNKYQNEELSLDADIPPKCMKLYDLMLKFSIDSIEIDSDEAIEEIKEIQALHHEELFLLTFVQDLDEKQAEIHSQLSERDSTISTLSQTIESLLVDRDAHKAAAAEIHSQLSERDSTISTLSQTIESLLVDRDAHKAAAGVLQQKVDDLERTKHEQLEDLSRVIGREGFLLKKIYESKSWRITAPLRYLARVRDTISGVTTIGAMPEATQITNNQIESGGAKDLSNSSDQIYFNDTRKYRILLVSYYYPSRAHAGGLRILDIYALIKQRCPEVQLDLLTHNRPSIDGSIADSHQIFDNIYLSPVEDLSPSCLLELVGTSKLRYEVVDLQFHQAAYHLEEYKRIASKVIFTPMESLAKVLYLEMRNQILTNHRVRLRGLLAQFKFAYEEISFCRNADHVVCVSKTDAAFIRAVGGGHKVRAIETGISLLEFAEALTNGVSQVPANERPKNVIYVAYFGSQTNVNALKWYLENVHNRIVEAVPDYKLVVVGRGNLSSFEAYRGPQVELVGEVSALTPYIKSAKIGIAPALGGSGFRGKVNQYAVLGIPAVVSPIALQGLVYHDGESVFVADASSDFADRCIQLLSDDDLNDRMAHEARKLCMKNYSWESKWPQISEVYGLQGNCAC